MCAQVAAEAPGESAVGRRVRVFWPDANAFHAAAVVGFNAKNGKHAVRYDVDGAAAPPRHASASAPALTGAKYGSSCASRLVSRS